MLSNVGPCHRVRVAVHIAFVLGVLASVLPFSLLAASSVTLAWNPSTGTNIAGYRIYYGATSRTYTNTVAVGNVTTATISNLVSGATYYFAATAYDTSNLESDFSNEASTNTLGSPIIVLTSPANNATFAAPATISLAAGVSPNGHSITRVQFYNGTTLLGEDASAPYSFSWSSVPIGSYSLTARLVYDVGSTLSSTAANVTVTPPLPTIVLTSPTSGSTYTAPATMNLAATVAANGHSITSVQFYNGTTLIGEDTTVPYARTWSSVPAGTYSLTARLVYDGGSTLTTPAATVLVGSPRNSPPTISTIANQTTIQDMPTAAIPFTVSDSDTPISSLTLFASSPNPGLIPTNNIVFGGSDSNRTVTLTPLPGATGTVAITIFVSDGLLSTNTTFQLTVQAPTNTLTLLTEGNGTISPDLSKQTVTPGQVYTVTAIPADGEEFAGWTGCIKSSSPRLTFVLSSNLVLKAKFKHGKSAPATGLAGSTYNGLFYQGDGVRLSSAGSFTLKITPNSKYSGRIQLGTKRYSFSGYLDPQLAGATNTISRRDGPALTLDFHIGGDQADQISGHLTDGTWTAALSGDRAGLGSSYAGTYTLYATNSIHSTSLPAGDSFGSLKVDSAGRVKFVGTLADGTKVSQTASLSQGGYWPLYVPLYSGNGSLMSWLAFASTTNSDLSGTLTWIKQPGSKSKYYSAGFTCQPDLFGSAYQATDPILNLPTAKLTFSGGGLTSDITNSITIGSANKVVTAGKELKLSFSKATGTFKGTFQDPASGKPLPFSGAVFQKRNAAYGVLFGAGDQTSEVLLTP